MTLPKHAFLMFLHKIAVPSTLSRLTLRVGCLLLDVSGMHLQVHLVVATLPASIGVVYAPIPFET